MKKGMVIKFIDDGCSGSVEKFVSQPKGEAHRPHFELKLGTRNLYSEDVFLMTQYMIEKGILKVELKTMDV